MEDKQFEEILRESWSPKPPEGMRDRILRHSRQKFSAGRRRPLFGMLRWKPLLAAVAVVIVMLMGVSEHQRQQRLTTLLDAPPAGATAWNVCKSLRERQLQIAKLLALAPSDYPLQSDLKGDERL